MKTNQIFNFARFGKYAKSTFSTTYKQTMLVWATIMASSFIMCLIAMAPNNSQWNHGGWVPLFISVYFVAGIIYAGVSFPQFRSKEKTLMALMVPVTPFERLLYEFIDKVVSFILIYPILFWVISSLAVFVRNSFGMGNNRWVEVNGIRIFPFETISYQQPFVNAEDGLIPMFFALSIFLFAIAFAGTATFRKYPLIKTIVFVGAVIGISAGYFALILEKFQLKNPWIANLEHTMTAQQGFLTGAILLSIMSLITLAYAYFKLKEKEVQ